MELKIYDKMNKFKDIYVKKGIYQLVMLEDFLSIANCKKLWKFLI